VPLLQVEIARQTNERAAEQLHRVAAALLVQALQSFSLSAPPVT
jgi:hypothetical protein